MVTQVESGLIYTPSFTIKICGVSVSPFAPKQNLEGILGDEIYPLLINSPEAMLLQNLSSLHASKVGQAQLMVSL
jgi:hypothetical protein